MPENRAPFYYLDKLVNVVCVDDDPTILSMLNEIFQPICIFKTYKAENAQDAEKVLETPPRKHLCILDLGISGVKNDEFYLLKRFSSRVSFLIFTGRSSPSKGFDAHTFGARAVMEKSSDFNPVQFLKKVSYFSLLNIINPRYNAAMNDSLSVSTELLFEKSPHFVSEWAQLMGLTDRTLRHIWTKNLGANAKIILSIYQMFETAFDYFQKIIRDSEDPRVNTIIESNTYRRLEEFFHLHKSTITDFILYGDVATF